MVHHGNGTEVSRKTFRHKLLFLYVILTRFTRKLRGNVSSHSPLGGGQIVGNPSSFFRPFPSPHIHLRDLGEHCKFPQRGTAGAEPRPQKHFFIHSEPRNDAFKRHEARNRIWTKLNGSAQSAWSLCFLPVPGGWIRQ